ncbi:MAG: hypothetical protein IPN76_03350 [Saprospiraceae bacterium]|nr:hypothetical protein [Saprospiraceae bacterium]
MQTAAEAYSGDLTAKNESFETWGVGLEFRAPSPTVQQPVLLRNYPNPFAGSTTIEFQLPEAAQVNFRLHDQIGRVVRV